MIVFAQPCPKCGVDVRSDEEHQCAQKSKPSKKPTTSPVTKTIASSRNSPSSRRTVDPPVITPARNHAPRNHVITPAPDVITPVITATQKEAERQARWREKNREAYNARMRAWRARQKAPE